MRRFPLLSFLFLAYLLNVGAFIRLSFSSSFTPNPTQFILYNQPPSNKEGGIFGGIMKSLTSAFEPDKMLKPVDGQKKKQRVTTSASIPAESLVGTSWEVQWFLTGVAEKDFSR